MIAVVSSRTTFIRKSHDIVPKDKPLMDLLPIPEGPWEELHKQRQQKYNMHLAAGVIFFVITIAVVS